MYRRLGIALSLVLAILAACSPVEVEDAYGKYASNIEAGTETLEVNEDGTYTHRYELQGIEIINNSGTWKYYDGGDDRRAVFQNYEFVPNHKQDTAGHTNGEWPAALIGCGFSVCISIDPETAYEFRKQ